MRAGGVRMATGTGVQAGMLQAIGLRWPMPCRARLTMDLPRHQPAPCPLTGPGARRQQPLVQVLVVPGVKALGTKSRKAPRTLLAPKVARSLRFLLLQGPGIPGGRAPGTKSRKVPRKLQALVVANSSSRELGVFGRRALGAKSRTAPWMLLASAMARSLLFVPMRVPGASRCRALGRRTCKAPLTSLTQSLARSLNLVLMRVPGAPRGRARGAKRCKALLRLQVPTLARSSHLMLRQAGKTPCQTVQTPVAPRSLRLVLMQVPGLPGHSASGTKSPRGSQVPRLAVVLRQQLWLMRVLGPPGHGMSGTEAQMSAVLTPQPVRTVATSQMVPRPSRLRFWPPHLEYPSLRREAEAGSGRTALRRDGAARPPLLPRACAGRPPRRMRRVRPLRQRCRRSCLLIRRGATCAG